MQPFSDIFVIIKENHGGFTMNEYINLNEVLLLASKATECDFRPVSRKKIMFQGRKTNGDTVTLCSPQSKMHPQGFYWVDITQEQARVLGETDVGIVFFRLEGRNLLMTKWADLKQYLIADCMRYNAKEQHHWKLYIFQDHIKISGNAKTMPTELYHYEPTE